MRACGFIICVLQLSSCVLSEHVYLEDNGISSFGDQDQTSQLLRHLSSVLDRLTSLDQRFDQRLNALDQRFNSFDQRLNALDQRVSMLLAHTNSRTNTVMQDLRAVCAELSNASSPSGVDVQPPSATKKPEVPFRISRVTKIEKEDSYHVRVTYEGSTKPIVLLRPYYDLPNLPLEDQGELGMIELDIPKAFNRDRPIVYFMFPEKFAVLHLKLENTPSSMDVPSMDFEVLQGKEIKFRPGEEITMDFTFDVEGDVENIERDEEIIQIIMQSDTEDDVIFRYNSFFTHEDYIAPVSVQAKEFKGSKGHRYGKVVLNSTSDDPEGMLEVTYGVHFNCSRNCLVSQVYDLYSLKFYREDHEGPFPKGFLGFVHDDFKGEYANHFYCDTENGHCHVYCEVIGDGVIDVEITRMTSAGDELPLDDVSITQDRWGSSQLFIENVTFADAGDYLCRARSQSKEVTQPLTVTVVTRARIIKEMSHVTTLKNGSVIATCVAEGTPAPNVTFDHIDAINLDGMDIRVTHPTPSQTRTDLVISDPDVASNYYGFYCSAINVQNESPFNQGYSDYDYLSTYSETDTDFSDY